MRYFIRYFGIMVSHIISDNDANIWNYIKLLVDILTAPSIIHYNTFIIKRSYKTTSFTLFEFVW